MAATIPTPAATLPSTTTQDQNFAMQAAGSDMFEIQSSQLALQKSRNPAIRRFAQQMVEAHTRSRAERRQRLHRIASRMAEDGFPVDAALAGRLNAVLGASKLNAELNRVYGKPGGGPWQAGDTMRLADLGRTPFDDPCQVCVGEFCPQSAKYRQAMNDIADGTEPHD